MTLDVDPEWIHFPIDEAITLHGLGGSLDGRAHELAIRREGRRLLDLEMTFVTARASLRAVRAAVQSADPTLDARVAAGRSHEVSVTVRFDPGLLASLPSNVAVLKRRLSSSPLSELANWSLLAVVDVA